MAVESHFCAGFSNAGMPLNQLIQHQQQQQQEESQFLVTHQQLQSFQSSQKQILFQPCEINNYHNSFVYSGVRNEPVETPMAYTDVVARQLENQRLEIDTFVNMQKERLKLALQVQREQQMSWLIRRAEARAVMVMRQKEEELAEARKRAVELQGCMKRMEMENLGWRRIVAESQGVIANLNASIEQVTETRAQQQKLWNSYCDVEDAASCCEGEGKRKEERGKKRKTMMKVSCKSCGNGDSSVVLLPCRHLCCCKACEASLYACPVCNSAKQGSIEALLQ